MCFIATIFIILKNVKSVKQKTAKPTPPVIKKRKPDVNSDIEEIEATKKLASRRAVAEKVVKKTRPELIIEEHDTRMKRMGNLTVRRNKHQYQVF